MPGHSRRQFIRNVGLGAAAAGVAAAVPAGLDSVRAGVTRGPETADRGDGTVAEGSLVAYVRDVRSGEIRLMVGEREIVYTDRELARSLARRAV
jgi:hypothetical protein